MGSITYRQAETHILSAYFQQTPADFGPFYIGLITGAAPMDEDTTLTSMATREVEGTGYQRAMIFRDDSTQGWELIGDFVQSPELSFFNSGITCWDPIDAAFLTLSALDDAAPDLLIAAVDFKHSTIVKPGQYFKFRFRFRQTTYSFNYQRLQCAEASIEGNAFSIPAMFGNSLVGLAVLVGDADIGFAVDPPDLTGFANIVGTGGVEIQPYPDAAATAFATTTGDANVV